MQVVNAFLVQEKMTMLQMEIQMDVLFNLK